MNIQEVIKGLDQLFFNRESDKVEDYLSINLEQAFKEGDVGSTITIINELIGFYRDTSQYDKAEKYCKTLLPFMEKAGLKDTFHYGTSCLNIANVYRASGRLDESLLHYTMVENIYNQTISKNDFHYASLYNNLSLLYQEMNRYHEAADALNKALEIVKEYPEAIIELAVTYTNLASSYVKAGDLKSAKIAMEEGLNIFEPNNIEDYHYSAALAVAGDLAFENKDYLLAIKYYEKAMIQLKKHVGVTHAYFRIMSNLQIALNKLDKTDGLKGMVLDRKYYECYGKSLFDDLLSKLPESIFISIGKIGEGSECFGFDDILSKDHDFGLGFGVFINKSDYLVCGDRLEEIYRSLPETFHGFSKLDVYNPPLRNGILLTEDFYKKILDLTDQELDYLMIHLDLPETTWLKIEDWRLRTATNGAIFEGNESDFSKIYYNLKKGYPIQIKKKRIAQMIGQICQEGQYNYQRMMKRNDLEGAIYMLHKFEQDVISLLFLINGQYAPHDKWLFKEASTLNKGNSIYQLIKEIMFMLPDLSWYENRDIVEWVGKTNEKDPILNKIDQIAREIIKLLKEEKLTVIDEIYLQEHIPYLLK